MATGDIVEHVELYGIYLQNDRGEHELLAATPDLGVANVAAQFNPGKVVIVRDLALVPKTTRPQTPAEQETVGGSKQHDGGR